MNKNEIKKAAYKQNPLAIFSKVRLGVAYYRAEIDKNTPEERDIEFEIPVVDMGDADFELTMEAKLLLRWLVD